MLTLLLLLTFTILVSCLFSGSETGFVSWNPLKVAHAAAQGNFSARLGMRLISRRGQLLTTVLIGNNVCNVASALLFAMLFQRIDAYVPLDLSRIPSPESWFLTPVLVVFSEMIPKSLYRIYAFSLTMKSVPALAFFFFLLSPIFWVVDLVVRAFGGGSNGSRNADVREEILLVAVEGARRGNIFDSAERIMKNTLGMKGVRIGQLAVGVDEWRRCNAVYRPSQLLSEFGVDRGWWADEVIVFDEGLRLPVGSVSLLDVAERCGGGGGIATFGALMSPLPRLKSGMEALSCLRRMPPDSPRHYLVLSGDEPVGILDKMSLFEAAFAKS